MDIKQILTASIPVLLGVTVGMFAYDAIKKAMAK